MKYSLIKIATCALALAVWHAPLHAFEPTIQLVGRKDLVLSIETRQTVLSVGATFLSSEGDDFLPVIEELVNPFTFEDTTPVEPDTADGPDLVEVPEPKIDYSDSSVLAVSSASFAKKVRGSIVRGDSSFLQLEGGVLLKPGTSFPVRLPQAEGQSFTLTITEITPEGYTLQIGEATKQLRFDNISSSNSNSIQFSNP